MNAHTRTLVTGATGHLGSHLALSLLQQGRELICSSRPKAGLSADERVLEALTLAHGRKPLPLEYRQRTSVLDLDLLRLPRRRDIGFLSRLNIEAVWHCAANTDLSPKRALSIDHENVRSTANMLELSEAIAAERFFFVGTAYSCGRVDAHVPEALPDRAQPAFRNAYEHSKWLSERLCWETLPERLTVLRPSIVLGPADARRVDNFQGFYAYVRKVEQILLRAGPGMEVDGAAAGVFGRESVGLNLVFVDTVAQLMAAIGNDESSRGRVYHLTAPKTFSLGTVADALAIAVGKRIRPCASDAPRAKRMSPILAALQPYLFESPLFARDNVERWLRDHDTGAAWMTNERLGRHVTLALASADERMRLVS